MSVALYLFLQPKDEDQEVKVIDVCILLHLIC